MSPLAPNPSLTEHLRFVRAHSPWFAEQWRGLPDEIGLEALPVTDHAAYWAANTPQDNRLLTAPHRDGLVFKSGGTTGSPKFSFFSNQDWRQFCQVFGQGLRRAGLREGEKVANIFYGGQLYASLLFITRCIEEAGGGLCFPIGGSAPPEELIDTLRLFRIETLAGVPTSLLALMPHLAALEPGALQVRRFIYGGEAMYPDQIAELKRLLPECEVASIGIAGVDYGEMGWVDASCEPGVHRCFDESTILEILDEEQRPLDEPEAEGLLHITNVRRRLMPIIRYPVGDRGRWIDPPGTPGRRFRVLGRTDTGARVGPMTLYLSDIERLLGRLKLDQHVSGFQLLIDHSERRDRCTLRIAVQRPLEIPAGLSERLADTLYAERHMYADLIAQGIVHPLSVEWVAVGELRTHPRTGKLQRVIDRRLDP